MQEVRTGLSLIFIRLQLNHAGSLCRPVTNLYPLANIDPRLFDKSNEEKQLEDSEISSFSWLEFLCQFRSASHACHALPVNKFRQIRPRKHNNLVCWMINLLLDVLLCSIAE